MSARPPARHIQELIASRRGVLAGLAGLAGLPLLSLPAACATANAPAGAADLGFDSVAATNADQVSVPAGYQVRTLIAWGDALFDSVSADFDPDALTRAEQEQRFGQNNDMLALYPAEWSFPPARDQDRMILCANNEYFSPDLMFPAVARPQDFTPAQMEAAIASTGISVVMLERAGGEWQAKRDEAPGLGLNRRITPFTPVVFSGPAAEHPWIKAAGAFVNERETAPAAVPDPAEAIRCGTYGNCAGGLTPWGTYLSAEENFDNLFALSDADAPALARAKEDPAYARDARVFGTQRGAMPAALTPAQFDLARNPHVSALYGWTLELDPYDPTWAPRKRTALGRRKGECATTALARDGRVAVYAGDDQMDEFVYKFLSRDAFNPAARLANRDLLDHGQLYAARLEEDGSGQWLAITLEAANAAAAAQNYAPAFRDEGDLMLRARDAARLLGATPMDRPEDVEALKDANWVGIGPVLICCTNNRRADAARPGAPHREGASGETQANHVGQVVRLLEQDEDAGATRFSWDVFLLAGDPDAAAPTAAMRNGEQTHVSTRIGGASSFTGARFACPDNLFIDSAHNVWISTDGSDGVFADCNDCVLAVAAAPDGARVVKRFMVAPPGAEICGPLMAPDERAFFAAIQHPGASDLSGADYGDARWTGAPPPSHFPDGGDAWPRSAVVVVTREDGGVVGR